MRRRGAVMMRRGAALAKTAKTHYFHRKRGAFA
jgi:hypothetical protein